MLTKLHIRNFKGLKDTNEIPLSHSVVLIGPNNSGKTTALQALYLWYIGLMTWIEKREQKSRARERTGVSINRKNIFAVPTSGSKYLWHNLNVRESKRDEKGKATQTRNILIEIIVEGVLLGRNWKAGLEFDFQNEEVLYCRPLRTIPENEHTLITEIDLLKKIKVAYLPPMSGLSTEEPKILPEAIAVRIGEGRTAEVLGNLCYNVLNPIADAATDGLKPTEKWAFVQESLKSLFDINLKEPVINSRGEIEIKYINRSGIELELSSLGRGAQQVLLLVVYMMSNTNATLLLDEPDAHLEILRQRRIYSLINEIANKSNSQIIAASHSEIVLQEAADKDLVVGFIGNKPFLINDKGSQLLKSLTSIGFQDYYQAEIKKWILYLEGSTDLAILKVFAEGNKHKALKYLETPFFHEIGTNVPTVVREHFYGIKEAIPKLKAIAIFDKINKPLQKSDLVELEWRKREIENYFFYPEVLIDYAKGATATDLFSANDQQIRIKAMQESIQLIIPPIALKNPEDEYWIESKASEQIERILDIYFKKLGLPILLKKGNYFQLAYFVKPTMLDAEITEKLDWIYKIAHESELTI